MFIKGELFFVVEGDIIIILLGSFWGLYNFVVIYILLENGLFSVMLGW